MDQNHPFATWMSNAVGGGAILASAMGWLPLMVTVIGGITAIVWYSIQIAESETVRRWTASRRARKVARLKAKLILLEAKPTLPVPPVA